MNPLVESLNHWGDRAADFAWPLLWQSSLFVGALLLLDLLLRRRARAVLRYALWLLVLLKLLLPPSLALPTGLGYWLGTSHLPASTPPLPRAVSVTAMSGTLPVLPASGLVAPTRSRLSRQGGLFLVWLAGSAVLLGFLARRSWQAARLLRQSHPANEELQSLLDHCRRQLGLRRTVHLKLSTSAVSPAVCGLWRPAMLLPRDLAQRLTPDQLRAVLFHELVHLRRHDVWVNGLQALLQVAYWWHPLVWLANARIRRVREEAVDEAVMVALGSCADTYPATLVEVAKLAFTRPLTALGLVGIFESKGALQQRIRRLLDRPVPRSAKLNVAGILAVVACGALLLPMARGNHASASAHAPPPSAVNSTPAIVLVECRFLDLDAAAVGFLNADPPALVGTNGHRTWVVPPGQVPSRLDEFAKLPGVRVAAAPRLTLVDGMTGKISDSHTGSLDGRGAILRYACEVTPRVNGTNIDLTLKATMAELVEVNGNGTPVLSASASGEVSHDLANVRVTVPDGSGVIVQNPSWQATQGGHLVLVVKPAVLPDASGVSARGESSAPVGVVISQKAPDQVRLETRIFKVDPNTFVEGLQAVGALQPGPSAQEDSSRDVWGVELPAVADDIPLRDPLHRDSSGGGFGGGLLGVTATNLTQANQDSVRAFLAAAGVNVGPPNQIYYKDRKGILMVRATPEELDLVQKAIEVLNVAPPQITIETKFMEAPDDFVKSLRQIMPGTEITSPDATNAMHVLSDPQARVLVRALQGTAGADVLAAPKVTTLSGRQAQIQVVDVHTILTGIDPRALGEPGLMTTGTTNASPFLSHPMPLGPTLDLIAVVTQDGYALELAATAGLTEFLGYDRPTNTVTVYVNGGRKEVEPPLPRLRTRQVSGRALVWEGQSLLLIGPAATATNRFADKVPVLGDLPVAGRLFRREGTFTANRRLLILITPTIVDPAGNPVHTPGDLPFDPDTVPPQPK